MEIPTLCSVCHAPRLVDSCPFCGALVCQRCEREGRHDCRRGMPPPGPAVFK